MKKLICIIMIVLSLTDITQINAISRNVPRTETIHVKTEKRAKYSMPRFAVSSTVVQGADSIQRYRWDATVSNWSKIPYSQIYYTYDANKNLKQRLVYNAYGIYSYLDEIHKFTYDSKNNKTSQMDSTYQDGWHGNFYNYTYDSKNNLTVTGSWFPDYEEYEQVIKTYDPNNNLISSLTQLQASYTNYAWSNLQRDSFIYDVNNRLSSTISQNWSAGAWKNTRKYYDMTWEANNNKFDDISLATAYITQSWDGQKWVNDAKHSTTFDANSRISSSIIQGWNSDVWVNSTQNTFVYDVNNNIINNINQLWSTTEWVNSNIINYVYDSYGHQISAVSKSLNPDGTAIDLRSDSTYYFYNSTAAGLNELHLDNKGISVYPNPSHGKFKISSPESSVNAVEIFNLLGKKVYSNANQPAKSEIDLSTAANGVYLLKIKNGTKGSSAKIVIQ
jgi:hypothetical protein